MKTTLKKIWHEIYRNGFTLVSLVFGLNSLFSIPYRAEGAPAAIVFGVIGVLRSENTTLSCLSFVLPVVAFILKRVSAFTS